LLCEFTLADGTSAAAIAGSSAYPGGSSAKAYAVRRGGGSETRESKVAPLSQRVARSDALIRSRSLLLVAVKKIAPQRQLESRGNLDVQVILPAARNPR
jgi:hypothetical protein